MLHQDHPVIALVEAMLDVAAAVGEFADVPSFEAGAGRQDHVGEFGFAFEPDGLVDDEFQVFRPVGLA